MDSLQTPCPLTPASTKLQKLPDCRSWPSPLAMLACTPVILMRLVSHPLGTVPTWWSLVSCSHFVQILLLSGFLLYSFSLSALLFASALIWYEASSPLAIKCCSDNYNSYSVYRPWLWNSLPFHVRYSPCVYHQIIT